MPDHEDETITEENAPPKVVPQITTVTNISAKFPYLKKGEYDIWAMKMQNFISSSNLLCWNIVLKGNSDKSMTIDKDGNLKIRPPVTAKEHQQVQREEKAMTILLSALPDEHMGDFYHMIDARDIWNAIKVRFDAKDPDSDKHFKDKARIKDVNMKFLRGLPPSWSSIALILKTKGGLEYISFDDLYNKPKFLEIDTKGYSSSSSTLSNAAFVSTAGSSQGNLSYQKSRNGGYTTTLSVSPGSSSSKGSSKSKCSVDNDVIYSFFSNHEIDQHLVYVDLNQMNKKEFEEYDLKHQMAMLSIKVIDLRRNMDGRSSLMVEKMQGKDISNSKAMVIVDVSIDWDKQTEEGNTEPRSLENFGMVAGIEITTKRGLRLDKYIREGELVIDDTKVSIFHTSSDYLEGQPIYNRFALVDHMKAVPPPLTGNYMPPSNISDIDESQMVYGKKATDSSEIKTNDDSISHSHDSVLFYFSDRSSEPSTNDL
nr:hypothetical protein [Tanacetum cinerariifolium]